MESKQGWRTTTHLLCYISDVLYSPGGYASEKKPHWETYCGIKDVFKTREPYSASKNVKHVDCQECLGFYEAGAAKYYVMKRLLGAT